MSEEKFTKGEWEIEHDNCDKGGGEWYIVGPAKVEYSYKCTDAEANEANANAHLIKTSPKMYAKLEEICEGMLNAGGAGNVMVANEIKDILAKARGESYE